ncbi:MAG TPA: GtrA family protein [Cellulomonas sp.]
MTSSGTSRLLEPRGPADLPRPHWHGPARNRLAELARFSSVGTVAFVVDMGTFNLLRFGPGDVLGDSPLTARVVAVLLATFVSWAGSRYWTFADQRSGRQGRELTLFTLINALGIGVSIGTLAFTHGVLDRSGPWWDNVANVLGIVLATAVRYVGYKLFVFTGTATLPTSLVEVAHAEHERHAPEVHEVVAVIPYPRPTGEVSGAAGSVRSAER